MILIVSNQHSHECKTKVYTPNRYHTAAADCPDGCLLHNIEWVVSFFHNGNKKSLCHYLIQLPFFAPLSLATLPQSSLCVTSSTTRQTSHLTTQQQSSDSCQRDMFQFHKNVITLWWSWCRHQLTRVSWKLIKSGVGDDVLVGHSLFKVCIYAHALHFSLQKLAEAFGL